MPLGAFLDHVVADITLGINANKKDSDNWVILSGGSVQVIHKCTCVRKHVLACMHIVCVLCACGLIKITCNSYVCY